MSSFVNSLLQLNSLLIFVSASFSHQSSNEPLIIRLMEKLPVHTEVVNLRQLFFANQTLTRTSDVDFLLAKRDEFPYMYFLINHSSQGILTIRKEIDRDQLCRLRRCRCETWCDLELEIVLNHPQFNIELLIIRLIDKNDHRPEFFTAEQQFHLTIVENAPLGAEIKLESAVDYDQGTNGIVGYSLVSSKSLPFSLRYDISRGDLALVVEQCLDRETTSSYTFDVMAFDGGNQSGTLHVHVTIDDVNDSPPKFEQSIYRLINISEQISIDSIIVRLQAHDNDSGVNGELSYHSLTDEPCFLIDPLTGDVRLRCLLDYETKRHYQLNFEVRDHGEGFKTDFCTLIIDLIDENDHAPLIDIYPTNLPLINGTLTIALNESLPINSLIFSFSVIDHDSGEHARVTWKLIRTESLPFELIRLTENTGELRLMQLLDRESQNEYQFTFEASDHGYPRAQSTRLPVRILILDQNDNRPKFVDENIQTTISEHVQYDQTIGYEVYHLQAFDLDQGLNGQLIYSIVNDPTERFRIDSQTGIIRAMMSFDRKEEKIFRLRVRVDDRGSPPLFSETNITFTIVTQNQYSPHCQTENNTHRWSIMENSPLGTVIGNISCYDNDSSVPNGQLSAYARWWPEQLFSNVTVPFDLVTQTDPSLESVIHIQLVVNGSIDRELISNYPFVLMVMDHGNPSLITNLSLSIEILDDNDHCPEFHLTNSFILVNRDLVSNPFIVHLNASDRDLNRNGEIDFELMSSTSPSWVHLDHNGTLIVETMSNLFRDDSLILLQIEIRDHGQPTPCAIVETVRLLMGSNQTKWDHLMKTFQKSLDPTSITDFTTELYSVNRNRVHSYSSLQAISSKYFFHLFPSNRRKPVVIVFIVLSIISSMLVMILLFCFVDRIQKKFSKKRSVLKINGHRPSPHHGANGKRIAISSTRRLAAEENSPSHHYTTLKCLKPVRIGSSSSSPSKETTTNTQHTYTAIETHDHLIPGDFDDYPTNSPSDIELMMTTV